MPAEGPGLRTSVTATKATGHGLPAVELGVAGIAAKSHQAAPAYPSVANAALAQQIGIGEEFVVMHGGVHDLASSLLPATAATDTVAHRQLYIREADNVLVLAATALTAGLINAGFQKFGLLVGVDSALGRASVNLNLRSAF